MNDPDLRSLGRAVERETTPPSFADLARRGAGLRRRRRALTGVAAAACLAVIAYTTASYTDVLDTAPPKPAEPTPQRVVVTAEASGGENNLPEVIDMTEAKVTVGPESISAFASVPGFSADELAWADLLIGVEGRQRRYVAGIEQSRSGKVQPPELSWANEVGLGREQPCEGLRVAIESAGVRFQVPTACLPKAKSRVRFQVGLVSYVGGTDSYQEASDWTRWVELD